MGKRKKIDDRAMTRVRQLWESKRVEGWTMQQLGDGMGYPPDSARKSVSQFLKSHDPQVSVLRRFAKAMEMSLAELLADDGGPKKGKP